MRRLVVSSLLLTLTIALGAGAEGSGTKTMIHPSAEETKPAKVGDMLPDVALNRVDGTEVSLHDLVTDQAAVLVFYRGGWCPYCNTHLQGLRTIKPELDDLGYQLIGLSPEPPEKIAETIEEKELDYTVLSDGKLELAKKLGIAFDLGAETGAKYTEYGATLVERALPVPTVILAGSDGVIDYIYTNPDYKVRLSNEELIAAAKKAANK